MEIEQVRDELETATRVLAGIEVAELDADGVRATTDQLRGARTQVARLDIALATRASELRDSGSCEDPVDLLTGAGAMPAGRARRVVRHADLLGRMPAMAAVLKAGSVSEDHIDAVAAARRRLDPSLRGELDALDGELTEHATRCSPDLFAEHLRFVGRRLERQLTGDLDLRRRRAVRVGRWVDRAGVYQLRGSFDHEMGARIFGAIDTAVETLRKNPGALVPGDDPNDRLGTDREFLAAHALARLVTHGHTAAHPGIPEIVVLVDEQTLAHGDHDATVCELHDGTPVDVDMVRRLCCEAVFTAVVVTAEGTKPLYARRTIRTASRAQRRALRAIHRTCAIADCTTPFDQCDVHHVVWWERSGSTDIDNLVPLCSRHHHLVHDQGWTLTLRPPDRLLTLLRPDGAVHSQCRPPGLRPLTTDPHVHDRAVSDPDPHGPPRRTSSTTAA